MNPHKVVVFSVAGCIGLTVLSGIITVIVVLASIRTLGPEDQVLMYYLDGKEVINGPTTQVLNPFRDREWRKALRIGNLEYIRIKDQLIGQVHQITGPAKYFMKAYEEVDGIRQKIVIKKDQYLRLTDSLTGAERVETGPKSLVPGPWEKFPEGPQQAAYVNANSAAVVLDETTGKRTLKKTTGLFFPSANEIVEKMVILVRVLPTETMVVRNPMGTYEIHHNSVGTSFFLEPFEEIVSLTWSVFTEPVEGGIQKIGSEVLDRIDMRARKTFFQYDVLTSDLVALRLEGAIFWRIKEGEVATLLKKTADPVADVWYKERNRVISVVSRTTLADFMENVTGLVQEEFENQYASNDDFYPDRGIEVSSIEITGYDSIDPQTTETLQAIIEETTNRMNLLVAQESENAVLKAKMTADIDLEKERQTLLQKQSANELFVAANEGAAEGIQISKAASSFMAGLGTFENNPTALSFDQKYDLYKLQQNLENQNIRAQHIASGKTTLFLDPADVNFSMNTGVV